VEAAVVLVRCVLTMVARRGEGGERGVVCGDVR
jgi:hypothetical protein